MIVQPDIDGKGEVKARTRLLAPSFEVERARLLGMLFDVEKKGKLEFIAWEKHRNAYSTLL